MKDFLLLLAQLLFGHFLHRLLGANAQVNAVKLRKWLAHLPVRKKIEASFRRDFRFRCRNRSNTGKGAEYAAIELEGEWRQQSRTVEISGKRRQPFGLGDSNIVGSLGQIQLLNFDLAVVVFSKPDRLLQSKDLRCLCLRESTLSNANDQHNQEQ